jgi:hypothetical protein
MIYMNGELSALERMKNALEDVQTAFAGEAERLGLKTEQDVVDLVKEVRREIWEENHARND